MAAQLQVFNRANVILEVFLISFLYTAPEEWALFLSQALVNLQDNLGKTIVLLMTPFDVGSLLRPGCSAERSLLQCSWINEGQQCRWEILICKYDSPRFPGHRSRITKGNWRWFSSQQPNVSGEFFLKICLSQLIRTTTFAVEVLPTLKDFNVDTAQSDDCLHPDDNHMSMVKVYT